MSYFIIYPRGDRNKISIVHLSDYMRYELSDYAVASRKEFYDDEHMDAIEYAKNLAKQNNKLYVSDDGDDYLD